MTQSTEIIEDYLDTISHNIGEIIKHTLNKGMQTTVYEELVRIRKAVENEVVVSSE